MAFLYQHSLSLVSEDEQQRSKGKDILAAGGIGEIDFGQCPENTLVTSTRICSTLPNLNKNHQI